MSIEKVLNGLGAQSCEKKLIQTIFWNLKCLFCFQTYEVYKIFAQAQLIDFDQQSLNSVQYGAEETVQATGSVENNLLVCI